VAVVYGHHLRGCLQLKRPLPGGKSQKSNCRSDMIAVVDSGTVVVVCDLNTMAMTRLAIRGHSKCKGGEEKPLTAFWIWELGEWEGCSGLMHTLAML